MEFSRQEYWSGLPFPSPGHLPDPGIKPGSPALQADSLLPAKLLQSCPTLGDPIDGSPPGSPVPGILQARTLEWVATSFSNAWKQKVKVKLLSRVRLSDPWTAAYQAPPSMGFSRQEYRSGVPFPSPMHESEKWKLSCSVVSDSATHGLQPTRLLHPWDFPGKSPGVGCHCLLEILQWEKLIPYFKEVSIPVKTNHCRLHDGRDHHCHCGLMIP